MEITICSYLAASFLLEHESGEWSAIVILDSGLAPTSFVSEHTQNHTYLTFDDITHPGNAERQVQHSHLKHAIEFATDKKRLIVSCRAGQSRSVATAFVVAYAHCGRSAALNLLNPARHVPNKLVVQVGSEVLEMPEIVADFEKWRQDNRLIKLADYYDEIEAEVEGLERRGAQNRIIA